MLMFFSIAKIQNEVSPNFSPLNQHDGRGFLRIVVMVKSPRFLHRGQRSILEIYLATRNHRRFQLFGACLIGRWGGCVDIKKNQIRSCIYQKENLFFMIFLYSNTNVFFLGKHNTK
jgi:hypothetical protein